jgi:hypothetical protein
MPLMAMVTGAALWLMVQRRRAAQMSPAE